MISSILAFSLILSATSLGDEVEFSRPSLELYEEFLLTRESAHIIFKFEDIRERARSLSVEELHDIRDDVSVAFSLGFMYEIESTLELLIESSNRRVLVVDILSRILAFGLAEKDHDALVELYEDFRDRLIDIASKPATTSGEKGLAATTRLFYLNLLTEMVSNLKGEDDKMEELREFILANIDLPVSIIRERMLRELRELVQHDGIAVLDNEDISKTLTRIKEIEHGVLEIESNKFQEWPLRIFESPRRSRTNLEMIQQIEELLEQ